PGLSRHAGAVHRRRGGDRRKYDRRPAGAGLDRPRDRGDGGAGVLRVETQTEALKHVRSPRPTALPPSRRYSPRLTWSFPPMKTQGSNTDVVFIEGKLHVRSEEHTSELQSLRHLVCRLLLEKKKKKQKKKTDKQN